MRYVESNQIRADHLRFNKSIHTVSECVEVTGFPISQITKSVVLVSEGQCIIGFVPAKFRASTSRIAKILDIDRPNVAKMEETMELTGYPAGGVPFIGYPAKRLVDPKIMEQEYVYTGGGSNKSLLKLWVSELEKFNPIIARIRK